MVRAAAERAKVARKQTEQLACEAWNKRMLGFQGSAQPFPALAVDCAISVPLEKSQWQPLRH